MHTSHWSGYKYTFLHKRLTVMDIRAILKMAADARMTVASNFNMNFSIEKNWLDCAQKSEITTTRLHCHGRGLPRSARAHRTHQNTAMMPYCSTIAVPTCRMDTGPQRARAVLPVPKKHTSIPRQPRRPSFFACAVQWHPYASYVISQCHRRAPTGPATAVTGPFFRLRHMT